MKSTATFEAVLPLPPGGGVGVGQKEMQDEMIVGI